MFRNVGACLEVNSESSGQLSNEKCLSQHEGCMETLSKQTRQQMLHVALFTVQDKSSAAIYKTY